MGKTVSARVPGEKLLERAGRASSTQAGRGGEEGLARACGREGGPGRVSKAGQRPRLHHLRRFSPYYTISTFARYIPDSDDKLDRQTPHHTLTDRNKQNRPARSRERERLFHADIHRAPAHSCVRAQPDPFLLCFRPHSALHRSSARLQLVSTQLPFSIRHACLSTGFLRPQCSDREHGSATTPSCSDSSPQRPEACCRRAVRCADHPSKQPAW